MGKNRDNDREDRMSLTGEIVESSKGIFKVVLTEGGSTVLCQPSGKIRQNKINLVVGDRVEIEVSPMDTSRGRVTRRL